MAGIVGERVFLHGRKARGLGTIELETPRGLRQRSTEMDGLTATCMVCCAVCWHNDPVRNEKQPAIMHNVNRARNALGQTLVGKSTVDADRDCTSVVAV